MTVKELIQELQAVDETLPVYQRDKLVTGIMLFNNFFTRRPVGVKIECELN